MINATIPPKDRPEWRQIVVGEINHNYNNFVLQMKIHQAMRDINARRTTIEKAIDEIFDICSKYALAVQVDFKEIFKNW